MVTLNSTILKENSTILSTLISTSIDFGTPDFKLKRILLILIKIFGGIDVLLICVYSMLLLNDRRQHLRTKERNLNMGNYAEINLIYENIDFQASTSYT